LAPSHIMPINEIPMSISPTLPPEIIDEIVDKLSNEDDRITLKACSAVCSSFRDPAQKKLFSSIYIHSSPKATLRNDCLSEILISNPHIATFIESVFILLVMDAPDTLLGKFLNLPRLSSIAFWDGSEGGIVWGSLSSCFRTDFFHLLQMPTLRSVSLFPMQDLPINALRRCSQLKSLSMTKSRWPVDWMAFDFDTHWVPSPGVWQATNQGYLQDQIHAALAHPTSRLS
jgi:hypothetical protein